MKLTFNKKGNNKEKVVDINLKPFFTAFFDLLSEVNEAGGTRETKAKNINRALKNVVKGTLFDEGLADEEQFEKTHDFLVSVLNMISAIPLEVTNLESQLNEIIQGKQEMIKKMEDETQIEAIQQTLSGLDEYVAFPQATDDEETVDWYAETYTEILEELLEEDKTAYENITNKFMKELAAKDEEDKKENEDPELLIMKLLMSIFGASQEVLITPPEGKEDLWTNGKGEEFNSLQTVKLIRETQSVINFASTNLANDTTYDGMVHKAIESLARIIMSAIGSNTLNQLSDKTVLLIQKELDFKFKPEHFKLVMEFINKIKIRYYNGIKLEKVLEELEEISKMVDDLASAILKQEA